MPTIMIPRNEIPDLLLRLRDARARLATSYTVGHASDLLSECYAAGLPPFYCRDAALVTVLGDYFDDCSHTLARELLSTTGEETQP